MARQPLDGIEVEITAETAAYLAAMNRMVQASEQAARRIERAFSQLDRQMTAQGAPGVDQVIELDRSVAVAADNIERNGRRVNKSIGGFGFGSGLKGIATQMAGFAAIMGAVGLANRSLQAMGDFERSIAMLGAVSESSAEQIAPLRAQAIQLGADTSRSANDVAQLQVELGKLGWNLERIKSSTPGILNLSIAGDMQAGEAAKQIGSTIQVYKKSASDAQEVADIFAQASIKSAADVRDFGTSLDYVGSIAAQYQWSLKETVAALMVLADAGLNPSMAATGLRSLLLDFTQPATYQAREFFKTIGFQAKDAEGKLKPLAQLVQEFGEALNRRGLSVGALPYGVIDTNSSSALGALLQQGPQKIRESRAALDDAAGAADRLAKVYTEGLQGSLERLSGAWDSFSIKVGDAGFLKNATTLVDGLTNAVTALESAFADGAFFGRGGHYDTLATYMMDAATGKLGTPGTMGERQAAYEKAYKEWEERKQKFDEARRAEANRAVDNLNRIPIGDGGRRLHGLPFDPSPASPGNKPKPPPPVDFARQQQAADMAREVRDLQQLADAATKGAEAYERAQIAIQRAAVVRELGAGGGRMFDQQQAATARMRQALDDQANLARELEQATLDQDAFQQVRFDNLREEIDALFDLGRAREELVADTRLMVEQELALAAAARQGAEAYERMRVAQDLMRQNTGMSEEEALALADQVVKAQTATGRAVSEMERLRQAAFDVGDAFASSFERAILDGGKLSDTLRALARDILAIAVRTAITAPMGNFIGQAVSGLFGGGRAIGGPVKAGVAYRVGEAGPELFVPDAPGQIIASHKIGGGGGGVVVQYAPVIDARGADAAAVARLEQALRADRAARVPEVRAIVQDAMRRRYLK